MLTDQAQTNVRGTLHIPHTDTHICRAHMGWGEMPFPPGRSHVTRPSLAACSLCLWLGEPGRPASRLWFLRTGSHDKGSAAERWGPLLPAEEGGSRAPTPEPPSGASAPGLSSSTWANDRSSPRCIFTLWTNSSWDEWGFFMSRGTRAAR